jgi:hypothetical protein
MSVFMFYSQHPLAFDLKHGHDGVLLAFVTAALGSSCIGFEHSILPFRNSSNLMMKLRHGRAVSKALRTNKGARAPWIMVRVDYDIDAQLALRIEVRRPR